MLLGLRLVVEGVAVGVLVEMEVVWAGLTGVRASAAHVVRLEVLWVVVVVAVVVMVVWDVVVKWVEW